MRNRGQVVMLAGFAFLLAPLAFGQEAVEVAIRQRVQQYEAAYNAGDTQGMAAIYAVDGTHTYAFGVTHRGRVEIAKGLEEQLAGPLKGSRLALTPLHIRALSPEVAVEEESFTLSGLIDPTGTALPAVNGLCTAVYQKSGDAWFAAAVHCLVPPSARTIPGITAVDSQPEACAGCHVNLPARQLDARLSTALTRWKTGVEPGVLAKAAAAMAAGAAPKGKHPSATQALADIPAACMRCHKSAKLAPQFARLVHLIHLTGGSENHYLSLFQGECTYCHKLDSGTGEWSVPSGPEK